MSLRCTVTDRRQAAGLSLTALASAVGISRQSLTAIEAGRSTPSTAIALGLARELRCTVEDLFALDPGTLDTGFPELSGRRVALGRVGGRWVAHGLDDPRPADAVVDGAGAVSLLEEPATLEARALVAGCAPVLGMVADRSDRGPGVTWVHASSGTSLRWLAEGRVHVAGMHLAGRDDPAAHDALVREALAGTDVHLIRLVAWREGLLLAPDNPLGLRSAADLARPGLRIARRPPGSGAAQVLARALEQAGAPAPTGPLVRTHAESAQAIRFGAADVAVAIEPVAEAFGLGFLPLAEERFELAVRSEHLDHPGVARLLDAVNASRFAREVRHLGAYDLTDVGQSRQVRP